MALINPFQEQPVATFFPNAVGRRAEIKLNIRKIFILTGRWP